MGTDFRLVVSSFDYYFSDYLYLAEQESIIHAGLIKCRTEKVIQRIIFIS